MVFAICPFMPNFPATCLLYFLAPTKPPLLTEGYLGVTRTKTELELLVAADFGFKSDSNGIEFNLHGDVLEFFYEASYEDQIIRSSTVDHALSIIAFPLAMSSVRII